MIAAGSGGAGAKRTNMTQETGVQILGVGVHSCIEQFKTSLENLTEVPPDGAKGG